MARLSAGSEGLPEEVLAACFPLSGGEQWPAAGGGGPFQVHADVLGLSFGQREVLLLQSLVLHLQEVRQEEVCQGGPRHVLKHETNTQQNDDCSDPSDLSPGPGLCVLFVYEVFKQIRKLQSRTWTSVQQLILNQFEAQRDVCESALQHVCDT